MLDVASLRALAAIALGVMACSSEPTGEAKADPESPAVEPTPELPVVDELSATLGVDGGLGIVFAGREGLGTARSIEVDLIDEQGEVFHQTQGTFPWLFRPGRLPGPKSVGHLEVSGGSFQGFMTLVDPSWTAVPERVRVAFGLRHELMGEWREAAVSPGTPAPAEVGARCDPFEVVSVCPEDALCDAPNGVRDSPTCHLPPETCPFDLPTLQEVYEGTNAGVPDETKASCTSSRGDLGSEQGHVFTAPQAATYRFTAESVGLHAATTLFVRRYCQFAIWGVSELGCAHESDYDGGPILLDLPLLEGQVVYVFVEAWWANGDDYRLSVEPLE